MAFIRLRHEASTGWSGGSGTLTRDQLPPSTLWPGATIPYELDTTVTTDISRSACAQAAILEWMNRTELDFVQRTNQGSWVRFRWDPKKGNSQYFPLGNLGRRNDLVGNSFNRWQVIAHELGHVVGFIHEHQRPDREPWITAVPAEGSQYEEVPEVAGVDVVHGPYDCVSINHYTPDDGVKYKAGGCGQLGTDTGLSAGDVAAVRHFYGLPLGRGVLHAGSAVSRRPDQLDVFTTAVNSGIYTAWWSQHQASGAWQGWQRIVNGNGTATSPVTAVARSQDRLDVFVRGSNNGVYTASWDGAWHGWWRIGDVDEWTLSAVGAVSRTATTLDAFVRDNAQRVRHAAWDQHANGARWQRWTTVQNGFATSDVTAVSRHPQQIDLFVRGVEGGVWTAAWDGAWHGWWRIGGQTSALGTNVAAASRTGDSLDVVAVDAVGKVVACGWDRTVNGGAWQGWRNVAGGVAAAGTSPVVVARRPDHLDVFVVGADRRVWTAWRPGTSASAAWYGWKPLFDRAVARGSQIAAVSRHPDRLDVFMLGNDGRTYTAAWDQHVASGQWRGWWPVAPAG